MLGLIQGRVYYNLISWYRVLALLPGFTVNRKFMEQMISRRWMLVWILWCWIGFEHALLYTLSGS